MSLIYQIIVYIFLVYIFLILFLNVDKKKREYNNEAKKLHYYILVPCVNEELVIRKTIVDLLTLSSDSKIVLIDDGSTDSTLSIMEEFESDQCLIIRRKFPKAQLGKGDALNEALKKCIEDVTKKNLDRNDVIIGVVDADGKLSDNTFTELNKAFGNPMVSAAQLRVKMYPRFRNTLQVSQDFEFFTVNNLMQRARTKTSSVGLSGNGQFFRLAPILHKIGDRPWGQSLLDDYELTLKLMLNSLKIVYISKAYVYQEALASITRYIKQRSRWVQGCLDCLSYLKDIVESRKISNVQKLSIFYFLSQPFINLLADICVIVFSIKIINMVLKKGFLLYFGRDNFFIFLVLIGILSISWSIFFSFLYYLDLKKYDERLPTTYQFVALPIVSSYIYIVLFFSIIIAFIRYLNNQHTWIKTKRN